MEASPVLRLSPEKGPAHESILIVQMMLGHKINCCTLTIILSVRDARSCAAGKKEKLLVRTGRNLLIFLGHIKATL